FLTHITSGERVLVQTRTVRDLVRAGIDFSTPANVDQSTERHVLIAERVHDATRPVGRTHSENLARPLHRQAGRIEPDVAFRVAHVGRAFGGAIRLADFGNDRHRLTPSLIESQLLQALGQLDDLIPVQAEVEVQIPPNVAGQDGRQIQQRLDACITHFTGVDDLGTETGRFHDGRAQDLVRAALVIPGEIEAHAIVEESYFETGLDADTRRRLE